MKSLRAGTETGSLMNHLMSGSKQPTPTVGMGATILHWTDRTACTVVEVALTKAGKVKAVTVQEDTSDRADSNGMSDAQSYTYRANLEGALRTFRAGRDGGFKGLLLGHRATYHDYSF